MRSKKLTSLVVFLASACVTPMGAESKTSAQESNSYVLEDGTRVVCDYEADTGSNRREKVCQRVGDIKSIESRQSTDQMINQSPAPKGGN